MTFLIRSSAAFMTFSVADARNRSDAGFRADSFGSVDRRAAPIGFPAFSGAAEAIVFRSGFLAVDNDPVRPCRAFPSRSEAGLPVGRAATRTAALSRDVFSGESALGRPGAGFASDGFDTGGIDASDAVRFPDLAGAADALFESADAADGLVRDCPVGANDAVRTGGVFRFSAATPAVASRGVRVAGLSCATSLGATVRAVFDPDELDVAGVDREATAIDFLDFAGVLEELLEAAAAADELGFRAAFSGISNDALRTSRNFRFRAAALPVRPTATRFAPLAPVTAFRRSGMSGRRKAASRTLRSTLATKTLGRSFNSAAS